VARKHLIEFHIYVSYSPLSRSQWPRGVRRGSAAAHLLGLWVGILPGAWMSVSCECCVLSGRGLCDGLVPRPGSPTECGVSKKCDHDA
jgi:hypothetical protein